MKKKILPLAAGLLLFSMAPFFAAAQTTEEHIETGRFGAEEPTAGEENSDNISYNNHWLFWGARIGPSFRFYTPSGDTAFTGGDTYSISLDLGILALVPILPVFSVQAEAVFTWDNASKWEYTSQNGSNVDRYTRTFTGFSLQLPLMAKLNFYPGKFRLSPFLGGYLFLPLGKIKTGSPLDDEESFSYSLSPPLGLLGGLSLEFPLGTGMIFADIRYAVDLGEPELKGGGGNGTYRRRKVTLSIGYEFGFFKKQ
jgi:hypothetical protein